MFVDLIILFLFYFVILFSILGYGLTFQNYFFKYYNINLGIIGLIGIFILIIYSYVSHYFISHNYWHNSIILIIGLILFLVFFQKIQKEKLFLFSSIFLILFISLIIFKTHDDFPYYHFPYTYYLSQEPLIVGIGSFNHGFRTHSSIFYLNSLYYLPIIKYFSFYIPTVIIMGLSNYILLNKIIFQLKNKKIDFICFYCLLFLIFFNIFFYRIQEHGTDRSAQILISILILYILNFIEFKKHHQKYIGYILILLGLIVSLKAFYIIYLILVVPLIWILLKENKLYLILFTLKHKIFFYFLALIILIISIYFLNTGCLLYPLVLTCFDNLNWSIGSHETMLMNNHYQLWSKAGKAPNFQVENPEIYLKNFNWIPNWIDSYFFNKVSDFIFGILFLVILVTCFFYKNTKNLNFYNRKIYLYVKFIYVTFIIIFFEWFLNHPSLRYGGYILFTIILFLPFSLLLERYKDKIANIKKKIIILISFTIIIFFSRNIDRINKEIIKYSYNPLKNPYYLINDNHFRVQKNFDKLITNFKNCNLELKQCDNKILKQVKEIFPNRYLFVND
ncbi:hypothetical protein [Candidatus Pelagibacter sp.]|uniref:hypothetical protein n=1 Tax=Candidatus Pelagibacter sp. TaxID=2024849 RepID=UPI003F840D53